MKKLLMAAVVAAVTAGPAAAVNVNWADWQSWNGTTTVNGVLDDNGTTVNVQFTSTANLTPAPQLNGLGTDYWQNFRSGRNAATSAYTNVGGNPVNNIPTGTDIIRMASASSYTLTFDQLVSDVYLSFVSLNGNAWTFSTQAVLLSVGGMNVDGNGTDDNGYWGGSTTTAVSVNAAGQWVLSGNGEPHGTLLLPGSFSQITWTGLSENWHGFTVGVKGVTPPAPPTVPVPAAGLLLAGGLALLSRLRRAR
ncbi:MAG: hypothetical protein KDA50_14115 [Rhodobacteraceae bacterium]|nr:hypothetical protein [Paracoccaceae bacterium]